MTDAELAAKLVELQARARQAESAQARAEAVLAAAEGQLVELQARLLAEFGCATLTEAREKKSEYDQAAEAALAEADRLMSEGEQ